MTQKDAAESREPPLPEFRSDLELFEGPPEPDGSKTWSLYDPVRAQYYRVTWKEALILRYWRPGMTLSTLLTVLNRETTLNVTEEDIRVFFEDAAKNLLLKTHRSSEILNEESEKFRISVLKWLLFHYLYLRFPLFNPMPMLRRTAWIVRPFVSRFALTCYAVASLIGIILVFTRIQEFLYTFTYFFSLEGILAYLIVIILVKFAHEFAHAFSGYFYGVNVPTIGIAFIVLWPVLYTDVTDSWRLPNRKDRLAITFSGVVVELVIAGLSTLGWALSSPGIWQSLFFVVSTSTWISSLMINLNPAMKFDGYYILSDLWGVDNLQNRAFAVARWKLRQWFLGIVEDPPEEGLSKGRKRGMVFYSLFTWVYRVIIYVSISLIIYFTFTKALGVLLLAVQFYAFLIRPLIQEAGRIKEHQSLMSLNSRLLMTSGFTFLFLLWFVLPWPHTLYFPAITSPLNSQVVYVSNGALVETVHVKRGDRVEKGDVIMQLSWEPLDYKIAERRVEQELAARELAEMQEEESQAGVAVKQKELELVDAHLVGMLEKRQLHTVVAKVSGNVYEWDETVRVGQAVAPLQVVGRIANLDENYVVAFIAEANIENLEIGGAATFRSHRSFQELSGTIEAIHPVREQILRFPQLGSVNQGPIAVTKDSADRLVLVESYYEVVVRLDDQSGTGRMGESGDLLVKAGWKSKLVILLKYIGSIFWQESGF